MYVKHLQEYLDQFTDGKKGTAISNAEIYLEMDNGRLEKIRRIEVQESTVIGAPSIRVVIKAEKRQAIISPTFNQHRLCHYSGDFGQLFFFVIQKSSWHTWHTLFLTYKCWYY